MITSLDIRSRFSILLITQPTPTIQRGKALIRGTRERLAQPGKVAIVYSQPKEAQEYRAYIAYLQAAGYLTPEVEEVRSKTCRAFQA